MKRGKKTTIIPQAKEIEKVLRKNGISDISYGIIIPVKGRKDHIVTIKRSDESGAHLLIVVSKRYKQQIRVYDAVSSDVIEKILRSLGENFRYIS